MDRLKVAFEEVADWCEEHLEGKRGPEIGMTFGAMLRAYGRLATLHSQLQGEQRSTKERQLNATAEELLGALSARFFVASQLRSNKIKPVEPNSVCTNMVYDTGRRRHASVSVSIGNQKVTDPSLSCHSRPPSQTNLAGLGAG